MSVNTPKGSLTRFITNALAVVPAWRLIERLEKSQRWATSMKLTLCHPWTIIVEKHPDNIRLWMDMMANECIT
jgi:hypothetical protein